MDDLPQTFEDFCELDQQCISIKKKFQQLIATLNSKPTHTDEERQEYESLRAEKKQFKQMRKKCI